MYITKIAFGEIAYEIRCIWIYYLGKVQCVPRDLPTGVCYIVACSQRRQNVHVFVCLDFVDLESYFSRIFVLVVCMLRYFGKIGGNEDFLEMFLKLDFEVIIDKTVPRFATCERFVDHSRTKIQVTVTTHLQQCTNANTNSRSSVLFAGFLQVCKVL